MNRWKLGSLLGAALGIVLPLSAQGAGVTSDPGSSHGGAAVLLAQYDGPPFAGPDGGMPPYRGYGMPGAGEDYSGPGGSPGYGPYPGRPGRYSSRSAGPSRRLSYHGFRIDLSSAGSSPNVASDVAAVEHQIDIVDGVRLSLSDLKMFRRYPIRIHDGLGGPGHYSGGSTVTIGNLLASDSRPVLLHEYMHVLHFNRLPGGHGNPTIRHFYEEAVASNLYQPGAYMLTNPGEFFAVTASCYLYGTVAREPYNRDTIRARQPGYYAYLEQLFGHGRTSHAAGPVTIGGSSQAARWMSGAMGPSPHQVGL